MENPSPHPNSEDPTEGTLGTEACTNIPQKIRIEQPSIMAGLWFAAWLFTIGFLRLSFWKGVLAIVIWPYYIGIHASAPIK
jgi:uncharacterized membrane protein